MSACRTSGCPYRAHTAPLEGFDGYCCIVCAQSGPAGFHGPRCQHIPVLVGSTPGIPGPGEVQQPWTPEPPPALPRGTQQRRRQQSAKQVAREPLCYYFSRQRAALLREVEDAYRHQKHGPGSLPPVPVRSSDAPPEFMLLVSHGASCDSFPVVAHAFHWLARRGMPPTVLILGTFHDNVMPPVALSARPWRTPLGQVEVDMELFQELAKLGYAVDEKGHSQEHSIENQLPFLQHLAPNVRVVPLGIGRLSLERARQVAQDIVAVTDNRPVLLLATTDYMHAGEGYYDKPPRGHPLHAFIRSCDEPVLAAIQNCSPELTVAASGMRGMCGLWPAVVLLHCAQLRGLMQVELLKYAVSGEVWPAPGCTGFASWVFTKPSTTETE
mmetsp:Transcript_45655/g.145734  ORF Transcript_45655/g.145734 Transcript_45655/m.145734 type:complete len:383 (-) Transcript_45655:55-1203(-)